MAGVVYDEFPDNNKVPPVDADHQSIVAPLGAVALIFKDPAPHLDAFTAVGGAGAVYIDAVTATRADLQVPHLDST